MGWEKWLQKGRIEGEDGDDWFGDGWRIEWAFWVRVDGGEREPWRTEG